MSQIHLAERIRALLCLSCYQVLSISQFGLFSTLSLSLLLSLSISLSFWMSQVIFNQHGQSLSLSNPLVSCVTPMGAEGGGVWMQQ